MFAVTLIMALLIGLIGVLLVGLPVHGFLAGRRVTRPLTCGLPGFVVPAVGVLVTQPFGADGALWVVWQVFLLGACGALVALVFRYVALGGGSNAGSPAP